MISGVMTEMDSTQQPHLPPRSEGGATSSDPWEAVRASLRNLQYGSVTIIVQDGVIIQIDRTEKRRMQSRRANQRGH